MHWSVHNTGEQIYPGFPCASQKQSPAKSAPLSSSGIESNNLSAGRDGCTTWPRIQSFTYVTYNNYGSCQYSWRSCKTHRRTGWNETATANVNMKYNLTYGNNPKRMSALNIYYPTKENPRFEFWWIRNDKRDVSCPQNNPHQTV